ncbi:helix-hairpin-helix domain-containing protein [Comamonas sp.]|uniref:helix-hairpin-helix domain-containing protein n=1 Tax=Comamonas sp. TaxID=34028 RepID=UPI003917BA4B
MPHDAQPPSPETPIGDLLPLRVKALLQKNGIHTVEDVRKAYPHQLLKIWGMGMLRFRQIEAVFFPGESFTPRRVYSPLPPIKGSSLNGTLPPVAVRALARGGITTVDQLLRMELKDLIAIKGIGPQTLREIERVYFPSQHYGLPRGKRSSPTLPDR